MLGIWVRDFKELEEKKAKEKREKIHKEQEERDIIETLPRNLRLLYTKSELTKKKNIYQSLFYANEVIIKSLDQGSRDGFLLGNFRVSGLIGYLYLSYGDFERAKNHAKRQLFMATEQLDDKRSIRDAFDLFSDIIIKCMSVNEEQAIDYAGLMIKEGKKVGDKSAEALGYYQKGYVYDEHLSNYVDALINYFKSLEINQEIGNNQGISCSYLRIGVVYYKLEMYDRALSYYQQFLKNAQAIDNKSDEAVAYRSIALVYRQLNQNVDQVILYYKKSLLVREELKDSIGMADCYNGIANAYYTLTDDFQQAKNYYLQAASIFKLYDKEQELVDVYYNLGLLYKKHNEKVEATGYFQKSISLAKEIGYQQAIIDGNIQLGISQSEAKIYKSAITNLSEAKLIARKQKSIKSLIEINQLLSETYEKIHNTNEALIALKESRKYGELYTTQQYQENKELDNQRASVTSWEIKIKKSKEDTGTSTYQWLFFSLIGLITLVAGTVALYHTKVFGIASFAGVGNKNKKQTEKILLTELTELKEQVNQVLNNNQAQYSDQIKQEAQAIYTKIQEIKTHQQHISKRGISKRKLKELWDILQNSQAFLALANQQKGNYNQTDHS
jgi:tetratricopeptide (TPR) repeat protein